VKLAKTFAFDSGLTIATEVDVDTVTDRLCPGLEVSSLGVTRATGMSTNEGDKSSAHFLCRRTSCAVKIGRNMENQRVFAKIFRPCPKFPARLRSRSTQGWTALIFYMAIPLSTAQNGIPQQLPTGRAISRRHSFGV
jgi:hypothetical protein